MTVISRIIKGLIPLVVLVLMIINGRYNVTVETGRPGGNIVETQKAATWLGGFVPAKPVSGCGQRGVARVQTRVTFLDP